MVKPWQWSVASNQRAVTNARVATTDLSRRRVEREDVELYLASLEAPRTATPRPARPA
ncbi:MAG: hypothetical protein ACXVWV_12360 [Nocardioides sp.]